MEHSRRGPKKIASSGKFVGNWRASALRLTEEAVEFAASGVERALLHFGTVRHPLLIHECVSICPDHFRYADLWLLSSLGCDWPAGD